MTLQLSKITKIFLIKLCYSLLFLQTNYAQTTAIHEDNTQSRLQQGFPVVTNNIRTAFFSKNNEILNFPILKLYESETILLEFDDLYSDQIRDYQFTLIHCDQNWEKSDLSQYDYLEGYPNEYITDYEYSVNTLVPYIHYRAEIPGQNLKITKSGNYLLRVFLNDPEEIILQLRLYVIDEKVEISGKIINPVNSAKRFTHQEISFTIKLNQIQIYNPNEEVKLSIIQNYLIEEAITDLRPKSYRSELLDYTFNSKSIFEAANEFRFIDLRTLKQRTINTKELDQLSDHYKLTEWPIELRGRTPYQYSQDINGQFVIESYDVNRVSTEADYALVDLQIPIPKLLNEDLFLSGGFTNTMLRNETRFKYDFNDNSYKLSLFLKQGYYNYQLYTMDTSGTKSKKIDGSFYETENEYFIFVYYRSINDRYDQLIGIKQLSSRNSSLQ
ncbi:MAG: hypothetical protein CL663_06275 [Bacteroidetes bacterium]|nr:hypothetical protein [Bacteroidota bacterium]